MNNYKILSIMLLALSIFNAGQAMEQSIETGKEKELSSLLNLSSLYIAKNLIAIYDSEFENDQVNAFNVMHNYIKSMNMPSELISELYNQIATTLKRPDIIMAGLMTRLFFENQDKRDVLVLFLNLNHDAKYNVADDLIDGALLGTLIYSHLARNVIDKILQNYHDGEFDNYILTKLSYKCEVPGCFKKFALLSNLKKHKGRVHWIKPYDCCYPNCNKSFNLLRSLRSHERTHGKELYEFTTERKEAEESSKEIRQWAERVIQMLEDRNKK